jgi:hypothetical protein
MSEKFASPKISIDIIEVKHIEYAMSDEEAALGEQRPTPSWPIRTWHLFLLLLGTIQAWVSSLCCHCNYFSSRHPPGPSVDETALLSDPEKGAAYIPTYAAQSFMRTTTTQHMMRSQCHYHCRCQHEYLPVMG